MNDQELLPLVNGWRKASETQLRLALGRVIRRQREFYRLTREELGRKAYISETTILSIEAGVRGTSLWTLNQLANALDFSLPSFMLEVCKEAGL